MPILSTSSFTPARFLCSPHAQTIAPALFRPTPILTLTQETLFTDDNDTIELEWAKAGSSRLAIVSHGLEGSSRSGYALGMGRILTSIGYDVLLWNMRGCGREPNRLPTWYHSGKTDDLARVVAHAQALYTNDITLVGISIGGNITLKYLGEQRRGGIAQAVAISVPCDLRSSAEVLALPKNQIYMEHLLRPLRKRIREKATRFPELFDCSDLNKIKTFHEFDRRFTAPLHGFSSVDEYWATSSSLRYLSEISTPTLIVSALDDPFLAPECFPFAEAKNNQQIILETPRHGGHVGFVDSYRMRTTWIERRVQGYLTESKSK